MTYSLFARVWSPIVACAKMCAGSCDEGEEALFGGLGKSLYLVIGIPWTAVYLLSCAEVHAGTPTSTSAQIGKSQRELEVINKTNAAKVNSRLLLDQRAEDCLRKGQYAQVVENTSKALEIDSEDLQAYCMRAGAYLHLGQADKANADKAKLLELQKRISERNSKNEIATCTELIKSNPKDAQAYARRGAALLNINLYRQAIEDCNKAIELDPSNKTAFFTRMGARSALHEGTLASADRQHFEKLNNANTTLLCQSAVSDYTAILTLHPDDVNALDNRAHAFFQLGRWQEAIQDCDKLLKLRPTMTETRELRLRCQQEMIRKSSKSNPNELKRHHHKGVGY
jgi:tetratricopeptide (TPR) repeat protein